MAELAGQLRARQRGQLSFHKTPESLRNEMMEQALNNGQQQNALELAQLAPVELKALLHPFLGGQWQNNTPTLRIPYYRPLEPLRPGFLPGRAEQHLAGQIYAGLTRFDEGDNMPIGDLAHHWQVLTGRPALAFCIRSTLYWHNGDAVQTAQLRQRLRLLPRAARLTDPLRQHQPYRCHSRPVSNHHAASS